MYVLLESVYACVSVRVRVLVRVRVRVRVLVRVRLYVDVCRPFLGERLFAGSCCLGQLLFFTLLLPLFLFIKSTLQ